MKVLWITNIATSAASQLLGEPANPFGGWLHGSLKALTAIPDLRVCVASPGTGSVRRLGMADGVDYVTFPSINRRAASSRGYEIARSVIAEQAPDLIHIHGTELAHSLSFATAAESLSVPVVVSIQGLVSIYAQHMGAHLPPHVILRLGTKPWRRSTRVIGLQRSFEDQGVLEKSVLRSVGHVIGRTSWDRACAEAINDDLTYHPCNETLRPSFYSQAWQPDEMKPHSILVGQGHYPIKGLHLLLEALPPVIATYPDTTVMVAGGSPLEQAGSVYGRHIKRLIESNRLLDHVEFIGQQDETEMIRLYKQANVVACPSVIENSPNSVGEAMLLGAPVIAAHVGGVPDLMRNGIDGLTYQADAPYMLADGLKKLFGDRKFATEIGANARRAAQVRHDTQKNAVRTAQIYATIATSR